MRNESWSCSTARLPVTRVLGWRRGWGGGSMAARYSHSRSRCQGDDTRPLSPSKLQSCLLVEIPGSPTQPPPPEPERVELDWRQQLRLSALALAARAKDAVYLSFLDAEREEEYRTLALSSHRYFLFVGFLVYGLGIGVVVILEAAGLANVDKLRTAATYVLQILVALCAILASAAMKQEDLLRPRTAAVVALTVLAFAGLMPTMLDRERDSLNESGQLMLVYLLAYSCCVPAFNAHVVAAGMSILCVVQLILCLSSTAGVENRINLTLRELYKGVVVNAIGCRIALQGERAYRANYLSALEFREQQLLQKKLQNNVHRLLTNTFPEPVVKDIANGRVGQGLRYERVTVLQADMVGFTPLSATHEPEEVLGILSDLFGHFDALTSRHKVSKIKTIGDAYVACCGVFEDQPGHSDHAKRVVAMGLAMAKVVAIEAKMRGIAINVRIGVHTGMVMGGVIGTVRFHFDMWGNGVVGAMKMEETGVKGKVHISDATAACLDNAFPLVDAAPIEPSFAEAYGIRASYLVDTDPLARSSQEKAPQPRESLPDDASISGARSAEEYTPRSALRRLSQASSASITSEYSARCSGATPALQKLSCRSLGHTARTSIRGLLSDAARLPRALLVGTERAPHPPAYADPPSSARPADAGGAALGCSPIGEHTAELTATPGGGGRAREEAQFTPPPPVKPAAAASRDSAVRCSASAAPPPPPGPPPDDQSSARGSTDLRGLTISVGEASPPTEPRATESSMSSMHSSESKRTGPWDKVRAEAREKRWLSGIQKQDSSSTTRRTTLNPSRTTSSSHRLPMRPSKSPHPATQRAMLVDQSPSSFFFETRFDGGEEQTAESIAAKELELRQEEKEEARRGLRGYAAQGTGIFVAQGETLLGLLCVCGLYDYLCFYFEDLATDWDHLPHIFIVRYVAVGVPLLIAHLVMRSFDPRSFLVVELCAAGLVLLPSVALVGFALIARKTVEPCAQCPGGYSGFYTNKSVCEPYDACDSPGANEFACLLSNVGGLDYCTVGQPLFYLRTLGMVHCFLHWTLIHSKLSRLMLTTMVSASSFLFVVGWVYYFPANESSNDQTFTDTATWILVANLIGAIHYFIRNKALWQHLVLRAQQQRALRTIKRETEKCEQLLANILPSHLIGSLASFLERLDVDLSTNDASIEDLFSPRRLTTPMVPRSPSLVQRLSARTPSLLPQSARTPSVLPQSKALVAERYSDCSFLFAKIGGLSELVNDDAAEPRMVIEVLQEMFDRFDRLSSIFNVQKVRKTANEYYLAAAGLPDPLLLPQPMDRAVGLASFGFAIINVMDNVNLEIQRLGIDMRFTVQVGIASGFAIAGIIGHKTFQYDLCGDAVNTAARMCSYSAPGRVHVSDATYRLLRHLVGLEQHYLALQRAHRFAALSRGQREIKGKGMMETYFLRNEPPEEALSTEA